MKLTNSSGRKNQRRIDSLERLKKQLKISKKNVGDLKNKKEISLTEEDILRINKELALLSSRIMSPDLANSIKTKKYRGAER